MCEYLLMTSKATVPTNADLLPWLLIDAVRNGLARQHPEKEDFVNDLDEAVEAWSVLSASQRSANLDKLVTLHPQLATALLQSLKEGKDMPFGWWLDMAKPMEKALRDK